MTQRNFYNGISAHPKAMMGKISHLLYIQNSARCEKPALNSTATRRPRSAGTSFTRMSKPRLLPRRPTGHYRPFQMSSLQSAIADCRTQPQDRLRLAVRKKVGISRSSVLKARAANSFTAGLSCLMLGVACSCNCTTGGCGFDSAPGSPGSLKNRSDDGNPYLLAQVRINYAHQRSSSHPDELSP